MRHWRYLAVLILGVMIGWSFFGYVKGRPVQPQERIDPQSVAIGPDHEIRILQPAIGGDILRLVPFAVNRGEYHNKFGTSPNDPSRLWLVTYDGMIVSCRSEQDPSQQP